MIGGVEKRAITIVDYDTDWPDKFERHARIIAAAIGGSALRIEHTDSANESAYLPQLEAAGYVLRVREPDWNEHRMFRTPEKDVHIHIYSAGCPEIQRNLTFRDRLRLNVNDRSRYEQTKRELAAQDWPDMNAYADAKTEVIESIIAASQPAGEGSAGDLVAGGVIHVRGR